MPTLRHDDVREELLAGLSETGRRHYETLGAVHEARQVTTRLIELRAAANLSQRQAAKRAGVDQADLSRIESGQITPSLPTLLRLLDAVGGTLIVARKRSASPSPEAARTSGARHASGSGPSAGATGGPQRTKRAATRSVAARAGKAVRRSA